MTGLTDVPPGVDPDKPTVARLYDYALGGTNNFPADRRFFRQVERDLPDLVDAMLANRGFHGRAAAWMARHGIAQFIDIGSGLPTQNNTHQSVRRVIPGARVVYADIDPMVAAHSGALLAGDQSTAVITADVRDPDAILGHPETRRLIDFAEPAGVLITAVMHFVADESQPQSLVARYMQAMAPGSYLALSHAGDNVPPRQVDDVTGTVAKADIGLHVRAEAEVARFFAGLELVPPWDGAEPGLTYVGLWGAEDVEAADTDGSRVLYCGVARRPEGFNAR